MSDNLKIQDDADELDAINFCRRSEMAEEITISGDTARGISRYIARIEAESDTDLATVQALAKELGAVSEELVKQNARLKAELAMPTEKVRIVVPFDKQDMCHGFTARDVNQMMIAAIRAAGAVAVDRQGREL